MSDVDIIPKIRCDNCGLIVEKEVRGAYHSRSFHKPRKWGSVRIDSGRGLNGYPAEELKFTDLCPGCAVAAYESAAKVLQDRRGETPQGGV